MECTGFLSDEEIEMLQNLTLSRGSICNNSTHDLTLHDPKLLDLLHKASHICIEATIKHHHIRFAVQLRDDEPGFITPYLIAPEIHEYNTPTLRSWRLDHPQALRLLDQDGKPLPFDIQNISTSGLLIQESQKTLTLGAPFRGVLSDSHVKIKLEGVVVRNKTTENNWQEWAIRLILSSESQKALQHYIYQQHQMKNYLLIDIQHQDEP